jgi:DNA-binding transcriptional MerR regulator
MRRRREKHRGPRRSRAMPKEGWSLVALAQLANVHPRTIRHYLQVGVLPRPPFRGTATRYGRDHLLTVLAIRHLQSLEHLELGAIRRRLGALRPEELEALATEHLPPGAAATALGIQAPPVPSAPSDEPRLPFYAPGTARWTHIELALGLELHVRHDASPAVMAMVDRVRELCAAGVEWVGSTI